MEEYTIKKITHWHLVQNGFAQESRCSYELTFSDNKILCLDWFSSVHQNGFILTIHAGVQAEALSTVIIKYYWITKCYWKIDKRKNQQCLSFMGCYGNSAAGRSKHWCRRSGAHGTWSAARAHLPGKGEYSVCLSSKKFIVSTNAMKAWVAADRQPSIIWVLLLFTLLIFLNLT